MMSDDKPEMPLLPLPSLLSAVRMTSDSGAMGLPSSGASGMPCAWSVWVRVM
jgi:hypothetical protein